MMIALAVLMIVTMMVGILEKAMEGNLSTSEEAATKIQADYACYGGAVRAASNLPDSFSQYDYYGTRVEVTVLNPPVSLLQIIMEGKETPAGSLRMLCAAAASPSKDSSAESTWYYLVSETDRPSIWTTWPGIARSQPYK